MARYARTFHTAYKSWYGAKASVPPEYISLRIVVRRRVKVNAAWKIHHTAKPHACAPSWWAVTHSNIVFMTQPRHACGSPASMAGRSNGAIQMRNGRHSASMAEKGVEKKRASGERRASVERREKGCVTAGPARYRPSQSPMCLPLQINAPCITHYVRARTRRAGT